MHLPVGLLPPEGLFGVTRFNFYTTMQSRDFVYWAQGYFEILGAGPHKADGLTAAQVKVIRNHLALVFKHEIDPATIPPGSSAAEMQAIHDGLADPKYCAPPKFVKPFIGNDMSDGLVRC